MNTAEITHPIDRAATAVGGRRRLASLLDVTVAALGNWKVRGTPIQHCWTIERASEGAVTRRDLRPDDAHLIWPDLAESEPNTPPAPVDQAQAAINNEVTEEGANA